MLLYQKLTASKSLIGIGPLETICDPTVRPIESTGGKHRALILNHELDALDWSCCGFGYGCSRTTHHEVNCEYDVESIALCIGSLRAY